MTFDIKGKFVMASQTRGASFEALAGTSPASDLVAVGVIGIGSGNGTASFPDPSLDHSMDMPGVTKQWSAQGLLQTDRLSVSK